MKKKTRDFFFYSAQSLAARAFDGRQCLALPARPFFIFLLFFSLWSFFFCLFRLRRFFLLFINFCHFTNVMCRAAHHDLFLDRSWHLIGRFRRRPISERRLCATGTVRTARRPREAKLPFESSKNFLFFFFKAIKWSHVAVFF